MNQAVLLIGFERSGARSTSLTQTLSPRMASQSWRLVQYEGDVWLHLHVMAQSWSWTGTQGETWSGSRAGSRLGSVSRSRSKETSWTGDSR